MGKFYNCDTPSNNNQHAHIILTFVWQLSSKHVCKLIGYKAIECLHFAKKNLYHIHQQGISFGAIQPPPL